MLRGGAGRKWFIKSDVRLVASLSLRPSSPITADLVFFRLFSSSFSTLLATTSSTRQFGCSETSQTAAVRSLFSSLSRRTRPFSDYFPSTRFPLSLALRTRRRSSSGYHHDLRPRRASSSQLQPSRSPPVAHRRVRRRGREMCQDCRRLDHQRYRSWEPRRSFALCESTLFARFPSRRN